MASHVLVLSVSAGAGHVRAAQPTVRATHLDLLTLVPRDFRKLYGESYIRLAEKLPQLWSYLYATSGRMRRATFCG